MNTDINETQESTGTTQAQAPKKKGGAGHIIFAVLAACCLVASLGLNIYQAAVGRESCWPASPESCRESWT